MLDTIIDFLWTDLCVIHLNPYYLIIGSLTLLVAYLIFRILINGFHSPVFQSVEAPLEPSEIVVEDEGRPCCEDTPVTPEQAEIISTYEPPRWHKHEALDRNEYEVAADHIHADPYAVPLMTIGDMTPDALMSRSDRYLIEDLNTGIFYMAYDIVAESDTFSPAAWVEVRHK